MTHPFGDVMTVNIVPGTNTRKPESAIRVQAKRLFDHGVKVRERLQSIIIDLVVTGELAANLSLETVVGLWVLK